jgi:hypothetical protein
LLEAERDLRIADRAWNKEQRRLVQLAGSQQAARTSESASAVEHRVYKPESIAEEAQLHAQLERGRRRLAELIELYTAQHPSVAQLQRELNVLERRCAQASTAAGTLQKQADRAKLDQQLALEQSELREQSRREANARATHDQAAREVDLLSASLQQLDRRRAIRCQWSDEPPSPAVPCGLWRRRVAFFLGCAASCAFGVSLLVRRPAP